jgi:membrane associated rhomboid family serine protease
MSGRSPFPHLRFAGPPGWRLLPPVTRVTLALSVAGYLMGLLAPAMTGLLMADPISIVRRLELWRLLTYPLVLPGIWNLLFGLLLFWALGSELEPSWGSRRYTFFLVTATVCAAMLGVGASVLLPTRFALPGYGISGLLTATIVAWALAGPRLPVSFFGVLPLTRGGFALLSLVIVVFGELEASRSPVRLLFLLGGLPVSWLWTRGRGRWSGPGRWQSRLSPGLGGRRRFRVVRPEDSGRFH